MIFTLDSSVMIYGNTVTLQLTVDFIKSEPDSDSEVYLTSHNENGMIEVKEEEDPLLIRFPVTQDENEVSLWHVISLHT